VSQRSLSSPTPVIYLWFDRLARGTGGSPADPRGRAPVNLSSLRSAAGRDTLLLPGWRSPRVAVGLLPVSPCRR